MEENRDDISVEGETEEAAVEGAPEEEAAQEIEAAEEPAAAAAATVPDVATPVKRKSRRMEKVGLVTSDKMQKTVVVRVERQVQHPKYRRYIRRRSKFMAHDELGARIGDTVRIVETRPMSAHKRWRVTEIIQRAR